MLIQFASFKHDVSINNQFNLLLLEIVLITFVKKVKMYIHYCQICLPGIHLFLLCGM